MVIVLIYKCSLMKWTLLLVLGLGSIGTGFSQYRSDYNWAVGLRAGATGATCGLTVKAFVSESAALEGIIGYWHGGFTGTALFEYHFPAFNSRLIKWYMGGGGHYTQATGYGKSYIIDQRGSDYVDGGAGYGIDGILGLEYKIPVAPVAFSLDVKPSMELNSYGGFTMALDPGLSVKLAF
jgi:hypothetical protein